MTTDSVLILRTIAGLLRQHRKSKNIGGREPQELVRQALAILDDRSAMVSLSAHPSLMRELTAEIGAHHVDLVHATVSQAGPPTGMLELKLNALLAIPRSQTLADEVAAMLRAVFPMAKTVAEIDFRQLLNEAVSKGSGHTVAALISDLFAEGLDAERGILPSLSAQAMAKPWREGSRRKNRRVSKFKK